MIRTKYQAYQNGYQNGIRFAYIPDELEGELLQVWAIGFSDSKKKIKRSYAQIERLK